MTNLAQLATVVSAGEAVVWFLASGVLFWRTRQLRDAPRKIALFAGAACFILSGLSCMEFFQGSVDERLILWNPKLGCFAVLLGCMMVHYRQVAAPSWAILDPFIAVGLIFIPPYSFQMRMAMPYCLHDFHFLETYLWIGKTAFGIGFSLSGLRLKQPFLRLLAGLAGLSHLFHLLGLISGK